MSSSPPPEFESFLRDFIRSNARTIFAASEHRDGEQPQPLMFTVYTNLLPNPDKGVLPASKSSIEALPTVTVTSEEEDCAICLMEYGVDGEVKELPCKHRYHSDCVTKWLGVNGSCPVCRYEMPVDEEEKRRRNGAVRWRLMISVSSGDEFNESDWVGSDLGVIEQSVEEMDVDIDGNENMEDLD
ncbi:hypothetical protein QVD17_04708 [Tagetes erecta]|uniref:RING-type E3 ubiquitin transferase n=1 Tax=Tagetes erecta TaxID=13708 RepID=A0AAD8LH76_TARER|nr:hypothetical protein QVD17_04708 [Tagetes erecta]